MTSSLIHLASWLYFMQVSCTVFTPPPPPPAFLTKVAKLNYNVKHIVSAAYGEPVTSWKCAMIMNHECAFSVYETLLCGAFIAANDTCTRTIHIYLQPRKPSWCGFRLILSLVVYSILCSIKHNGLQMPRMVLLEVTFTIVSNICIAELG